MIIYEIKELNLLTLKKYIKDKKYYTLLIMILKFINIMKFKIKK